MLSVNLGSATYYLCVKVVLPFCGSIFSFVKWDSSDSEDYRED